MIQLQFSLLLLSFPPLHILTRYPKNAVGLSYYHEKIKKNTRKETNVLKMVEPQDAEIFFTGSTPGCLSLDSCFKG